MAASAAACTKPCCCDTAEPGIRAISTSPGATLSNEAERVCIRPCFAKLVRTRSSYDGSLGEIVATQDLHFVCDAARAARAGSQRMISSSEVSEGAERQPPTPDYMPSKAIGRVGARNSTACLRGCRTPLALSLTWRVSLVASRNLMGSSQT